MLAQWRIQYVGFRVYICGAVHTHSLAILACTHPHVPSMPARVAMPAAHLMRDWRCDRVHSHVVALSDSEDDEATPVASAAASGAASSPASAAGEPISSFDGYGRAMLSHRWHVQWCRMPANPGSGLHIVMAVCELPLPAGR